MATLPPDLAKLGFELPSTTDRYRLLVGSQGLERTGKTEFALTAPGPIGYLSLDIGLEGVVEKWVKRGKKVWVLEFNIPAVTPDGKLLTQQEYLAYWNKTRIGFETLVSHKDVRTVVVDTGSQWWDLAKLAEFGTVTPRVDVKVRYPPLNQLFRSLIKRAYDTDKNLIITHTMKEKYTRIKIGDGKETDSWDGKSYKRSGFGEENYLIQVNIEHFFRDGKFGATIQNARQNMQIAGYEMSQEECTFANLGMMIYDETTEKDWS